MFTKIEDTEAVNGMPAVRYVEAKNQKQAVNHVLGSRLRVTTLSQGEVISMLRKGIEFETATTPAGK